MRGQSSPLALLAWNYITVRGNIQEKILAGSPSLPILSSQLRARNHPRHVVFAQLRVERCYIGVQHFLQLAHLGIDAPGKIVEDGVGLLCRSSLRVGDNP